MGVHTILLIQPTKNLNSRTYRDFETISRACDYLIEEFEVKLKQMNPNIARITYDPADLQRYVDSMADMGALVYEQNVNAYAPHDKTWIKQRVTQRLIERATKGQSSRR